MKYPSLYILHTTYYIYTSFMNILPPIYQEGSHSFFFALRGDEGRPPLRQSEFSKGGDRGDRGGRGGLAGSIRDPAVQGGQQSHSTQT